MNSKIKWKMISFQTTLKPKGKSSKDWNVSVEEISNIISYLYLADDSVNSVSVLTSTIHEIAPKIHITTKHILCNNWFPLTIERIWYSRSSFFSIFLVQIFALRAPKKHYSKNISGKKYFNSIPPLIMAMKEETRNLFFIV